MGQLPPGKTVCDVLFVTAFDLSGHSGSNVATRSLVKALSSQDRVAVTLLAPIPADESDLKSELPLAAWDRLPKRSRPGWWWHLSTAARVWVRMRRRLKGVSPDMVVVRYGPYFTPSAWFFPREDSRLVVLIRGRMPLGVPGLIGRAVEALNRRLAAAALARADDLFLAYRGALPEAERRLRPGIVKIVSNAADITAFPEVPRGEARREFLERRGLALHGKVVGFVGSIRPRHCLEELLQASAMLVGRELDHEVLVVGDGPVRPRLEALAVELGIRDTVHFLGRVPHAEVGGILAACDVLYGVVDPENPSNPIKVYEALAAGRPVVTSPQPELIFVQEERLGILATGSDPGEIAEALEGCFAMEWTEKDVARARTYIERNHTWDGFAQALLLREGFDGD